MRNDIGPHFMKLTYRTNGHVHTMQFSVREGTNDQNGIPTAAVEKKSMGTYTNQDAIDALVAVLKPLVNSSDSFQSWERYWKPSVTGNALLQDSGTVTSGAGTGGSADIALSQAHYSFQDVTGQRYGLVLLEGMYLPNTINTLADLGTSGVYYNFVQYMLGSDSFVCSRAGNHLRSFQRVIGKINDTLRKQYIGL